VKYIKNSVLFAIVVLLFVLGNQTQAVANVLNEEASKEFHQTEIQQSVGTLQLLSETFSFQFVKENKNQARSLFFFYPEGTIAFFKSNFPNFLSRQDHNRCEKVSKLLFPFHFFW